MKTFIILAINKNCAVKLTFIDGTTNVFDALGQEYGEDYVEFLYGKKQTQILINLKHVIKAEIVDRHVQKISY